MLEGAVEHIKKDMSINRAIWAYHDKPERIPALGEIYHDLTAESFWYLFHEIWTNTESVFLHHQILNDMVGYHWNKTRFDFLSDDELNTYKHLSKKIQVFRGCCQHNVNGWSWTTDRNTAEWFAHRFSMGDAEPQLVLAIIQKSDIIGLYMGRGEEEICVRPEDAEVKFIYELDKKENDIASSQTQGRQALMSPEDDARMTIIQIQMTTKSTIEKHNLIEQTIIDGLFKLGFHSGPTKRKKHLELVKKLWKEESND
jgi:hypothetical protein